MSLSSFRTCCANMLLLLCLFGCATTGSTQYKTNLKPYTINGKTYYPMATADNYSETGVASWYGPKFHGKKTASGEKYNQNAMTAAHKTLPFGTRVRVTNLGNGKSADVVINDRGPFIDGRIIDLSRAAAKKMDMMGSGTARVKIKSLGVSGNLCNDTKVVTGSGENYYVQVGAFSSRNNADALANKLKQAGYQAHVKTGKNGNYVVQTGAYSTKTKAERARDILKGDFSGAFVVW